MGGKFVFKPELEFHFMKTYAEYDEFIHECDKKCCKLANMDFFTKALRELAGVPAGEYPYVVAINIKKKSRRKRKCAKKQEA